MSQNTNFDYNGSSFYCDMHDADFVDKVSDAINRLNADYKNMQKDGSHADIIRASVKIYKSFFDAIFGDGAGDIVCGAGSNVRLAEDAYMDWLDFCSAQKEQQDERRRRMNQYAPNRVARRAAAKK